MITRRVPANPDLTWSHAAPGSEYRVTLRNEETGHKRTLYRGQETRCRLPVEVRRSGDQWSFRVEARPVEDDGVLFSTHQRFKSVDRVGDDFVTPSPDLLVGAEKSDADTYLLIVQRRRDKRRISELIRHEPRFLLAPGQIDSPTDYEWRICALTNGVASDARWRRVSAGMVEAARARSLVDVGALAPTASAAPAAPAAPVVPAPAGWPVEVAASLAAHLSGPSFLVTVDLTADPLLASEPDPARVLEDQWISVKAGGSPDTPSEAMLSLIERHDLRAVVLVDVLAALALDPKRLAPTVRRLADRGHRVELLVRTEPWFHMIPTLEVARGDLATATALALAAYREAVGREPILARFITRRPPMEALSVARTLGLEAVMVDAASMSGLPLWMRGRTQPFLALDDLVVVPQSRVLSTPAHAGDLTLMHGLTGDDPFLVSGLDTYVAAAMTNPGRAPQILSLRALAMLAENKVRAPDQAGVWNRALEQFLPAWVKAGLTRSAHGYQVANGPNDIAADLANRALSVLTDSGFKGIDPVGLSREGVAGWSLPVAVEPLVEMRRGSSLARMKTIRRYDAAYRDALAAGRTCA